MIELNKLRLIAVFMIISSFLVYIVINISIGGGMLQNPIGINEQNHVCRYSFSEMDNSEEFIDNDSDGLDNMAELERYATDPDDADTDGDGLTDGKEIHEYGTYPFSKDSDNDGLSDCVEVKVENTDPMDLDTDNDRLNDSQEVIIYDTDPLDRDTDADGIPDGFEVNHRQYNNNCMNPNSKDTDGDGYSDSFELDYWEVADPCEADEYPETATPDVPISNNGE
jgi:hypothetical protein